MPERFYEITLTRVDPLIIIYLITPCALGDGRRVSNGMNTQHFKQKLEEELAVLETELSRIGRRNPENPDDWEAKPEVSDIVPADKNEAADHVESFEANTAMLKELEARYNNVKLALQKIEKGAYGICEVSGKPIEEKRLEANPSARTCTVHMNESVE